MNFYNNNYILYNNIGMPNIKAILITRNLQVVKELQS